MMRKKKRTTAFWWILAVAGATSLLLVATSENPPVRVAVDEWEQGSESVSVYAILVNESHQRLFVTVEFTLDLWSNSAYDSGYTFCGRSEHTFEVGDDRTQEIHAVVPLVRKTNSKVKVSAVIVSVNSLPAADE